LVKGEAIPKDKSIYENGGRGTLSTLEKKEKAKEVLRELFTEDLKSVVSSAVEGAVNKQEEKFQARIDELKEELTDNRKNRWNPAEAGAPFITSGPVGDKGGYSFLRVIRAQLSGNWKEAKNERGVHEMLDKEGFGQQAEIGYWITPLNTDALPDSISYQVKGMLREGLQGVEMKDVQRAMLKVLGIGDDSQGGYLVEPTQAPEIIDLLRPAVVLQRAGAQEIPLPVSGQLDIPRQTGGVDAQWVGENTNLRTTITTNATFGQLQLRAKKLATFQQLSSELASSSSPAMEAVIRRDMALKIAEKEDSTWLDGAGTQSTPMGIIVHPSIVAFTVSTTAANGDTIEAQDVQLIIAEVEENNAVMQGWIMRPQMLAVILTKRANQGTAGAGEFLFDIVKDPTGKAPYLLGGHPVHTTTQVSGTRIKGSGTTLSYTLAGMFTEAIIGRKASLEIKASADAGTAFETDQIWLRGITRSDFGLRHQAAFVFADNLLQS
tara:strand:- start:4676 stop:6151 length:1476 start_codon:yes stop_codon:yes gene_type:complete